MTKKSVKPRAPKDGAKEKPKTKPAVRPIFWVSGNFYECKQKWEEIKSLLGDDVNLQDMECGSLSSKGSKSAQPAQMGDVIMLLKNNDLFDSNRRLIRVYGCPPDYTLLADYLHLVDDDNVVVMYGPVGCSGDRFVSAKTSNLYKQINEWKHVFEYAVEVNSNDDAIAWIRRVAGELKRPLDADAANLLVTNKGRNLDILYSELVKLIAYCDDRKDKALRLPDVEAVSIPEFTRTVWDLIESLDLKQYDQAMLHLRQFYAYADVVEDYIFTKDINELMGALEHHFTFLALIRSADPTFDGAYAAVCGQKDSPWQGFRKREKVGDKWTYTKNAYEYGFLKMSLSKSSVQAALRWPQDKLWQILCDVYRCSHLCRTMQNAEVRKHAIELLVMHVCGFLSLESASRLRGQTV